MRDQDAGECGADTHAGLLRAGCGGEGDTRRANLELPLLIVRRIGHHGPEQRGVDAGKYHAENLEGIDQRHLVGFDIVKGNRGERNKRQTDDERPFLAHEGDGKPGHHGSEDHRQSADQEIGADLPEVKKLNAAAGLPLTDY
jgi:hypothetical protein